MRPGVHGVAGVIEQAVGPRPPSLRHVVLAATGQDVRRCAHCALCATSPWPDQDLSFESVLQLVVMNDEEVLTSSTVWSHNALYDARTICANNLDMEKVMLALRDEARRRGLK